MNYGRVEAYSVSGGLLCLGAALVSHNREQAYSMDRRTGCIGEADVDKI
jgi:hypothetical protein